MKYDDPASKIIILPKATLDRLLKTDRPAEAIALYTFYCYTAKWQNTNDPKCTVSFAAKGLSWGETKVREIKNILKNMGLIEDKSYKNGNKIAGWYTHLKYFPTLAVFNRVGNPMPNALSNGNIKDTKVSTEETSSSETIETEFSFGEENSKSTSPFFMWIMKVATDASQAAVDAGASQPFTIPRDESAKYIKRLSQYIQELRNGNFNCNKKFDPEFLKHLQKESLRLSQKLKGMPDVVIYKSIEDSVENYLTARNNEEYDFIARDRKIDLATFMYEYNENNGVLGVSHFLKYLGVELEKKSAAAGPERMLSVLYKKDLQKMYKSLYYNYRDFDDTETARMIKSVLSLCRWWNRNVEKLSEVYRGTFKIRFPDGMYSFIEYYLAGYISEMRFEHPILLIPEKKYWKAFGDYIFEHTSIDLDCDMKKTVKESSGVTITEIQKRMEED